MTHGLSKCERICSVKAVEALVSSGHYLAGGPLRCCFIVRPSNVTEENAENSGIGSLNRIMVSVPKKFFRRAVKRNLLKRRIRESYRLQKELLPPGGVDMLFVYTSKDICDFRTIFAAMEKILNKINERTAIKEDNGSTEI